MKKKVLRVSAAVMLLVGTVGFAGNALAIGNADCDAACESSTEFHCLLTYTDGSQVICLNRQVKGTKEEIAFA